VKIKNKEQMNAWKDYGGRNLTSVFPLGPNTSYQLYNTPRRVLFNLSRYKFAAKIIGEQKSILELGCSDGFFTCILTESCKKFLGVDYDTERIEFAKGKYSGKNIEFKKDDFMDEAYGLFDGVISFDVIEHIFKEDERKFADTIYKNLSEGGIGIVGTPNITSRQYSSPAIDKGHINMYDGEQLKKLFEERFHNVLMFSQNDEVIHTGFMPMAHYLVAVFCNKKV